jgi:hypothetical protein
LGVSDRPDTPVGGEDLLRVVSATHRRGAASSIPEAAGECPSLEFAFGDQVVEVPIPWHEDGELTS